MSKLKALSPFEFGLLYYAIPLKTLAKELDIDKSPLWKRAKLYCLPERPNGRPYKQLIFKGEGGEKYPPMVMELLIKSLIADGASDKRLEEKGYTTEYIKIMRKKYDSDFIE